MRLRALDPVADRRLLEHLWTASLGPAWPMLPRGLDLVTAGIVAEEGAAAAGVIVIDPDGSIPSLMVHPLHQRRGVATTLLQAGCQRLAFLDLRTVGLGSGAANYIWPGVPDDLTPAVAFFEARGWRWDQFVIERAAVSLHVMTADDRTDVLAFEAAHFPHWVWWYERLGGGRPSIRAAP